MNAEIISISKQLYSDMTEKNVKILKDLFELCSININNSTVIGTGALELKKALKQAVSRSEYIVICGGVGTGEDDNTVKTVCSAVGLGYHEDESAVNKLKAVYGDTLTEQQLNAALVPNGATVFDAADSLALGCAITAAAQSIIILPDEAEALKKIAHSQLRQFMVSRTGFSILDDDIDDTQADDGLVPIKAITPVFEDDEVESEIETEMAVDADPTAEDLNLGAFFDEPAVEDIFEAELPQPEPEPEAEPVVEEAEPEEEPEEENEPETESEHPSYEPEVDDGLIPASELDWNVDAMFSANSTQDVAQNLLNNKTVEAEPKQANIFTKMLQSILPWKGDRLLEVVRKLVFIIAIVGLSVSAVYISEYFIDRYHQESINTQQKEIYNRNEANPEDRFAELKKQNSDVIGWLTIGSTRVDNAVYQTDNNDYYINHNALKEESVYGALFADYKNRITKTGNNTNITIYGHHMKDGTMLADIHKYKSLDFYKESPTVTFDTIYGTGGVYKVFACMITNADRADDNGYFFNYTVSDFNSNSDFMSWIEQVRRRSLYITPVDVVPGDQILTLSTCTYEIKNVEMRCVVLARKVRENEDVKVNTSETSYNSKIIYPAIWYEKKGGQKPVYEDGLTTWLAQPDYENFIPEVDVENNTSSEGASSQTESGSASSGATSSGAASSGAASSAATSSGSTTTSNATSSAGTTSSAASGGTASTTSSAGTESTTSTSSEPAESTTSTPSQAASSAAAVPPSSDATASESE